jgi:CubicO group peptidase (beta-lactamase class C family)
MLALFMICSGILFFNGETDPSAARTIAPAQTSFAAQADAILSGVYKPNRPGAAILVMKGGTVFLRKAYGMADLELGVALEPDMVFQIGSMTKQFTAVAILMLIEQGRLSLSDPLTRFLSDYPTRGRTITVEHLLTHTSGIPSYTSLPEWPPLMRTDMTLAELIAVFKDKPLEFEPGEYFKYSNSGYILLGAIIEKASGVTYEAFLQRTMFDPLGLKHTHYGSADRIIPRRVSGYEAGPDGTLLNAGYISMTQTYAAGSLLSSVDDLAAWNEALLAGKLIGRETLDKAWTAHRLKDGTTTGYGFGWSVGVSDGRRIITHDGDINGFSSEGYLIPEEKLFVTLLTNTEFDGREPRPRASRIAALALGKPDAEPKAVSIDAKMFDEQYAGEYELAPGFTVRLFRDGNRFMSQGTGEPAFEIFPESETSFFLKVADGKVGFLKDETGKVTGIVLIQGGRTIPAKRIAK